MNEVSTVSCRLLNIPLHCYLTRQPTRPTPSSLVECFTASLSGPVSLSLSLITALITSLIYSFYFH